jgi:2-polyprenyl-3-methyl-5-hydroxy-6-metoxy-1,4-benzoquinol methylase
MWLRAVVLVLVSIVCPAQNPDYDLYREFRGWAQQLRRSDRNVGIDQMLERYAEKLRAEGVPAMEIERRTALIRSSRTQLEDDFWNRYFTQGTSNYNRAPNGFLVEVVEGRKPGTALDYGMGEGRNALYLARKGWRVSGFDPAAEAVKVARRRATEMGLTL